MHAQYVPVLTDIAPLLLIRELPQDEYPTPALPRPFTSHDVEPVMFGRRTSAVDLNITRGPRKEPGLFMKELAEFLKREVIPTGTAVMP